MRPVIITKSLTAADAAGVCASQTPGGAGNLTINGTFASGGVATLNTQRLVGITSAGNASGVTFTVVGTNWEGIAVTETITGPNISTVSTTIDFLTVTQVSVSGAPGVAVTVGTTAIGSTQWVTLDQHVNPVSTGLFIEVTGTINVTVQYTGSNIIPLSALTAGNVVWTNHPNLTSKTAATDSNTGFPAAAVRMMVNSGTGSAKFIVRQGGLI